MLFEFFTFFSIYLVAGFAIIFTFSVVYRSTKAEVRVFVLALLFKLVCTYYYYVFTLNNSADATGYYGYAKVHGFLPSMSDLFNTSSGFVNNAASLFFPFASFFDNQYLMLYIPFSLLGFCGSLLFYRTLQAVAPVKKRTELYAMCFFLPNMVFWTSNLGKDSLIYLGISMVLYGFVGKSRSPRNLVFAGLGGLLVYFVRPHVLLFLMLGFLLGIIFEGRRFSVRSVIVFVLVFGAFLLLHAKIFELVGVNAQTEGDEQASISSYYSGGVARVEGSSKDLNIGGSATGAPHKFAVLYFPYYLFTFLTSPFIWQARKPIQFVSALETIIYQLMIVYLCLHWKDVSKITSIRFKYAWLMYLVVASIIEGAAQTNFGLIVRQRCMVLPVILLLFSSLRYYLSVNKPPKRVRRLASVPVSAVAFNATQTKT